MQTLLKASTILLGMCFGAIIAAGSYSCGARAPATLGVRIDGNSSLTRITNDSASGDLRGFLEFNTQRVRPDTGMNPIVRSVDPSVLSDRKGRVSNNGRFIAFRSIDSDLIRDDLNKLVDIFVADALTGAIERVSIGRDGAEANGMSEHHDISGDGRYVSMSSEASNLVDGDRNLYADVFVFDRTTRTMELISRAVDGGAANGPSSYPPVSDDGRFIAFASEASNLVAADGNSTSDIFLLDRSTRQMVRITRGVGGVEANGRSTYPSISSNGRFVVFTSAASNLVPDDRNGVDDVFIYDRESGAIVRVSVGPMGAEANGPSYNYTNAVSSDGQRIAFASRANNLVTTDDNGNFDVFVREVQQSRTVLISRDETGRSGNSNSLHPTISAGDGRYVAFHSGASNLVSGDSNGTDDVFVYDMIVSQLRRISVGENGREANAGSYRTSISADGSTVSFSSDATNLAPRDTNAKTDVFLFRTVTRSRR